MPKKRKLNGNNGKEFQPLREFKPKTRNQNEYVRSIIESDIVLCTGPPGTGKTACAVGLAVEHLFAGKIEKVVVTRPVVESGRGLGYLPGDFQEKIHPYLLPILDELSTYLDGLNVQKMIRDGIIEIAPLEYMRGRNFHNAFMLLDEGQNATIDQIKMFLTRIGRNSKVIINGDLEQSDLLPEDIGLRTCINKLHGIDMVSIVKLTTEDIIRHNIIQKILKRLEN